MKWVFSAKCGFHDSTIERLSDSVRSDQARTSRISMGNLIGGVYAGIGHNGSPHAAFDDALAFARGSRCRATAPA